MSCSRAPPCLTLFVTVSWGGGDPRLALPGRGGEVLRRRLELSAGEGERLFMCLGVPRGGERLRLRRGALSLEVDPVPVVEVVGCC